MEERNYHSRLLHISLQMDSVIEKLKMGYIDEKLQVAWWQWLLLAPLRDIAKVKDLQKGIATFFTSNALVSLLPLLLAVFGPSVLWFTSLPNWITPLVGYFIGYVITMFFYFPQLTQFKSDHFHLGAYKTWRKQEYELFRGAFLDQTGDFYFKGLYDYSTNSKEGYKMVESLITDYLAHERTQYLARIQSLEDNTKQLNQNMDEITQMYEDFTSQLMHDKSELLAEFEYVIHLLKDINTLLFRIHNKGLELRDLNILTGFTLYELKEDKLHQIADVGTSGITSTVIDINDERYANYGAVKVIKEHPHLPYFNHPYPGHVVVSYRINIDHTATWVYNFHFDDSNTRAWKLLVDNGIIESKEIYRLIHALCLLSQNENLKRQEGAVS